MGSKIRRGSPRIVESANRTGVGNHCSRHVVGEVFFNCVRNFPIVPGTRIVLGAGDLSFKRRIHGTDLCDDVVENRESVIGDKLGLEWHEEAIGTGYPEECQGPSSGWAIDDYVGESINQRGKCIAEGLGARRRDRRRLAPFAVT